MNRYAAVMGNREDLVEGAKRCLLEKGYSRTTARDISAAAGVSLAAIGYHFGSKEALLNEALQQAIMEWGDDLAGTLAASVDPDAPPAERFEATWTNVVRSFAATRALWGVQFELLAHIDRNPELRHTFTEANRHARLGLAELFGIPVEQPEAAKVGAYLQMLLAGAAAQWLADPQSAPSSRDLLDAMHSVTKALTPSPKPAKGGDEA
jgi:AcrR family transcriptional regulator